MIAMSNINDYCACGHTWINHAWDPMEGQSCSYEDDETTCTCPGFFLDKLRWVAQHAKD